MAVNNTCLATCDDVPMVYQAENNACKQCHIQCAGGCSGPVSLLPAHFNSKLHDEC
jgi:hypothetical protein